MDVNLTNCIFQEKTPQTRVTAIVFSANIRTWVVWCVLERREGGGGVVLGPVTEIVVGVAEVLVLKGGISHISRVTIVVAQKAPHLGLPSLFPSELHRETDR